MTKPVPTAKPWVEWITGGIAVQIMGGTILAAAHHSNAGLAIGATITWIGVALLFVGLIALGVYLGTRHLSEQLALNQPSPATPAATASAEPSPAPDNPAIVAEVRQAIEMRATKTAVRRVINKAAREGRLTAQDRIVVESLFDEHYPPAS